MGLEDYLMANEQVRFRSGPVEYGGKRYDLILTNKRLILYAKRGLLLKKDDVISWKIDEIREIRYYEKGIMKKRGYIRIVEEKTQTDFYGPAKEMKVIYQRLMEFW